jgi:hypothetical protein
MCLSLGPLSALGPPLQIDASGRVEPPVSFAGETFAAWAPVTAATSSTGIACLSLRADPGRRLAVRIRRHREKSRRGHAAESGGRVAEKTNVGVVALVNVKLERRPGARATCQAEGDALAAAQGRAEDVFAGVILNANRHLSYKLGYRFLEGGVTCPTRAENAARATAQLTESRSRPCARCGSSVGGATGGSEAWNLEAPVEPEDREDALLLAELPGVRAAVPAVAREISTVRQILHAEEDVERLTAHGERAVHAKVHAAVVGRPLGIDAREVIHAAALGR